MHPVLFTIELAGAPRALSTYGALFALGIALVSALTTRAAVRAGLDAASVLAACGFTAGGALAGGWLLFLLVEWARTGSPMDALARGGGFVFFGALLGGGGAFAAACRGLALPARRLVDLGAPALPIGHALGRLGCFFAGCCYGRVTDGPLGVVATHPLAPAAHPIASRHPVALYEALALLGIALAVALWPPSRAGARFAAYVAAYAAVRFVIESLRGDAIRGIFLGVSTSQWIAAALAVAAVLTVAWPRRGAGAA